MQGKQEEIDESRQEKQVMEMKVKETAPKDQPDNIWEHWIQVRAEMKKDNCRYKETLC